VPKAFRQYALATDLSVSADKDASAARSHSEGHRAEPDETGEYEGIGRPYTTTGGKTANVRVKRVESDVTMSRIRRAERVNVKRAMAEEDKR
jgi:hypothetical protein